MSEGVQVWLGLDPATASVLVLLNGQRVGRLAGGWNQFGLALDAEYEPLRPELTQYCAALFSSMPETLRAAMFEAPSFAINAAGRDAAATVPPDLARRIHLGCGTDVRPGWLNVDYSADRPIGFDAAQGVLNYDLRFGFPLFEDGSADLIFSSHFFEHLRHDETMRLLHDCRRLLRKGGKMRFQMPDFSITFRAYLEKDPAFLATCVADYGLLNHMPEHSRNYADLVSVSVYEHYLHKYVWDEESLTKTLKAVGFEEVVADGYQEGLDHAEPTRVAWSFHLTAIA